MYDNASLARAPQLIAETASSLAIPECSCRLICILHNALRNETRVGFGQIGAVAALASEADGVARRQR